MYTAINLDKENHNKLVQHVIHLIPEDWKIFADHYTVNMGKIENGPLKTRNFLGGLVELEVESIAANDKVIAVGIKTEAPSLNKYKHITIAVNVANGGKPVMSNNLTDWHPIETLILYGTVEENQ